MNKCILPIKDFIVLGFSLLFLGCQPSPTYLYTTGEGRCANGKQDPDEFGVDCGGACVLECNNIRPLEGELFRRLSLETRYTYLLTGPLIVRDQASLEIPAGTLLKVQPNSGAYIAITQGGQLFVWGTAENPVTIESNSPNPNPGDWGGIIICGKSPTGKSSSTLSSVGQYFYGGNLPQDSSGYIRYLRISHAGASIEDKEPFSSLSLYGTGSYTQIDHLWITESLGNGMEIDGGTVDLDDILIENSLNDGIHLSDNWQGSGSRWHVNGHANDGLVIKKVSPNERAFLLHQLALNNNQRAGLKFDPLLHWNNLQQTRIQNSLFGFWLENDWTSSSVEDHSFLLENIRQTSNRSTFNHAFETSDSSFSWQYELPSWTEVWSTP